jgi:hypothetical protein
MCEEHFSFKREEQGEKATGMELTRSQQAAQGNGSIAIKAYSFIGL